MKGVFKLFRDGTPQLLAELKNSIKPRTISTKNRFRGKVFCIGFWKTGTTSIGRTLKEFGYKLANQATGEMLLFDWSDGNLDRIVSFCETADAFQDTPMALPGVYKAIDIAYPGSKFILSVRDSGDQWFDSLARFHSKLFGNGDLPSANDLKASTYRYQGYVYETMKTMWDYPLVPLYDRKKYIAKYEKHNRDITSFFEQRPEDLIVINVSKKGAFQRLADFLNVEVSKSAEFPWMNKT